MRIPNESTVPIWLVVWILQLLAMHTSTAEAFFNNPPPTFSSALSSSSSSFPPDGSAQASNDAETQQRHCVVVGGGPVGLAASLTLSNPPHSYRVTLLEKSQGATSVQTYDPTRAYLYLVNPRGLEWFDRHSNTTSSSFALERLFQYGSVSSALDAITVPADPKTPIDPYANRGSSMANLTLSDDRRLRSVWVPRHQMIQLLVETCEKQNRDTEESKSDSFQSIGNIEICNGKQVVNLEEDDNGNAVRVECSDGSLYTANLVVGADGIDSAVRSCLARKTRTSWLQGRPHDFDIRAYSSPSAGIKLKCLQFPPNFTLTNTDGTIMQTQSTTIYSLRSINSGTERLSLGMLPVKDPTLVRPANINTRYNHKIWSISDGPTMKEYFTKSFPRIEWDTIIKNDEEWERFATAKGTKYPKPQYCPGSMIVSPANDSTGVVLVGDACHAFPPDIGQGINAGLNDVVALDRSLRGQEIVDPSDATKQEEQAPIYSMGVSLKDPLTRYQKNRRLEHKALIRLARFGAPFQYRQSWRRDRVGSTIWMMNAAFRQIMNKLTFGIVPPIAVVSLFQTPPEGTYYVPYRKIMNRADATTTIFKTSVLLSLVWLCIKIFLAVG